MFQFKAKFSAVMLDGSYPQLADLVVVTRPHSQGLSILGSPFPLILLPSDLSLHPRPNVGLNHFMPFILLGIY